MARVTDNKSKELFKFATEEIYKVDKNIPSVNTEKEIGKMFDIY